MADKQKSRDKVRVLVISGSVASGKSTVAAALSELLENAPTLTFDDYEAFVQWPEDMAQWVQDGADPSDIRVPQLQEDLITLLNGEPIQYPVDNKTINPAGTIILEEPSGRERQEIAALIDKVIFVDTPQDICAMRMIQRVIDMETWASQGTFEGESKEDLTRQLNAVATWITQYKQARSMYMHVSEMVKLNADIIVDGTKPAKDIASDILNELKI